MAHPQRRHARDLNAQWPVKRSHTPARGFAMLLGAGVLFVGVASLVKPPPRSAAADTALRLPAPQIADRDALARLAEHSTPGRLLGTLEGRDYRVHCYASPDGPRYTVYRHDGTLLQGNLPADEVYRSFPGLDLNSMRLEPDQNTLMLMDGD